MSKFVYQNMTLEQRLKTVKKDLDQVSSCMCLAKWLQVTLHLQNGNNHSCHHNPTHKADLQEIKKDPSALHNTVHKKIQRQRMLTGDRPEECFYCWKVEDSQTDTFSDRYIKSSDNWAEGQLEEIANMPWESNINPTYVEVSFGNLCNFACSYCLPDVSSKIYAELERHGPYPVRDYHSIQLLRKRRKAPYKDEDENPYVQAFWEWFPTAASSLKVFRITGGEPLLHKSTFRVFDHFAEQPNPKMELSVNSNFNVPDKIFQRFIQESTRLLDKKAVQTMSAYSSVDTCGAQAEYIRDGLEYDVLFKNMETFLRADPRFRLTIMITFNALSFPGFKGFLEDVLELRTRMAAEGLISAEDPRFAFDISNLHSPEHMNALILPKELGSYLEDCIEFIGANKLSEIGAAGFNDYEALKMNRVRDWFMSNNFEESRIDQVRGDFYAFFHEYDQRRKKNFLETFPELEGFYRECEQARQRSPLEFTPE